MALIVVYDEGASPQAVLDVIPSANTPDYAARTDVLVNPDLSGVAGLAEKYWKVVGSSVDPMTAGEQSAVDAAEAAAQDAAMRSGAKANYDGQTVDGQTLRALVEVLIREVNILRQQHSLADRTLAQAKAAIQQAIDDGDVDE